MKINFKVIRCIFNKKVNKLDQVTIFTPNRVNERITLLMIHPTQFEITYQKSNKVNPLNYITIKINELLLFDILKHFSNTLKSE